MPEKIKNTVLNFLKKYSLLNSSYKFIVGFSGGYDSLCLLDVLNELSKDYQFSMVAAHLNHNWRSEESKYEELNAQKLCKERNIEFHSETLSENLPHTEVEARKQRYGFFERTADKYKTNIIFTGHTATDQAETVLYRIIKGTGIKGLAGIPEKRTHGEKLKIFRPLLDITREQTIEYCKISDLEPNIDSSNLKTEFLRNKIRLELVPELKTYNKDVENSVIRLSEIAKDYEEIVNDYISEIKKTITMPDDSINSKLFMSLKPSMQKKIILDLVLEYDLEYDYKRIEEILRFIDDCSALKSGNTFSLAKNLWLFASSKKITVINEIRSSVIKSNVEVNLTGKTFHPEAGKTFIADLWENGKPEKFPSENSNEAYIDLNGIKEKLFLRKRQSGDIIQPFGMSQKVKLKKYLINKGIPEHERDKLLILGTKKEALWVVGVGISELIRVKDFPTHKLEVI